MQHSMKIHAAQDDGIFGTDLMAAETPDALCVCYLGHPTVDLDRFFRANAFAFAAGRAFIRDNGAFSGWFFTG
jgi:hypothetical protein